MTAIFEEAPNANDIEIHWKQWNNGTMEQWNNYVQKIIDCCIALGSFPPGILTIENDIPLGKGMGASTAFVIAIARCLLGNDCKKEVLQIEDALNPGHSGIDFAVIWHEKPVLFCKGSEPKFIELPKDILEGALLIDSGTPDQTTPELVAWVREKEGLEGWEGLENGRPVQSALHTIGRCTERLIRGEEYAFVMRDHEHAQEDLGVVSDKAKRLIKLIVQNGGSAKVIGAGGRTGGSGMVLAIGIDASKVPKGYEILNSKL